MLAGDVLVMLRGVDVFRAMLWPMSSIASRPEIATAAYAARAALGDAETRLHELLRLVASSSGVASPPQQRGVARSLDDS